MSHFPEYLHEFPNMHSDFPFHLAVHHLKNNYQPHRHDYIEISLVFEGEGIERINGESHPVSPGTFSLILPYQIHEIGPVPGQTLRLFNGMFHLSLLFESAVEHNLRERLLAGSGHLPDFIHVKEKEYEYLYRLFEMMLYEYNHSHLWKQTIIKSKVIEALSWFDRLRHRMDSVHIKGQSAAKSGPTFEHLRHQINDIVQYVHLYYREPISLTALSEQFHMSPSYLSDLFKKTVGSHYVQFIHELRIRHARGLLKSTDMAIYDIALEVGYGSYKTFSRVFKQMLGVTPSDYRNNL